MLSSRKGQQGGKQGGGMNLQTIGSILGIVMLLLQLTGACEKEEDKEVTPEPPPPPITTALCNEQGGLLCSPSTCVGPTFVAGDATSEQLCCTICDANARESGGLSSGRGGTVPNGTAGGDAGITCQSQGVDCQSDGYCPEDNWIQSSNSVTCCALPPGQTQCLTRIQSSATFGAVGNVIVERFPGRVFGVWYGGTGTNYNPNPGFTTPGLPNFALATDTDGVFSVTIQDASITFQISGETSSSFQVTTS